MPRSRIKWQAMFTLLTLMFVVTPSRPAISQAADLFNRIEIPASPQPVGSGARALGMGGAFIAVADDATAASWNPGGLIQLERPEISFVYDMMHRSERPSTEDTGHQTVSRGTLNYLSAVWPFQMVRRNMVVSLTYQNLYDFTRRWRFPTQSRSQGFKVKQTIDHGQSGELSALGLAYCIQITPRLSLGITLNIWDDDLTPNEWEQETRQIGSGVHEGEPFESISFQRNRYTFNGINANIGLLYQPTGRLRIGAVFKSPFSADLNHTHAFTAKLTYPDLPKFGEQLTEYASNNLETLDMPASYGIGLAWRIQHNFLVSMDLYRTEWGDFRQTSPSGPSTSPITGTPQKIDPTHQFRVGMEYLWITRNAIFPLCAGLFYDPTPGTGNPDDVWGFSLGSGIGVGRFHVDATYQYRIGNDVESFSIDDAPVHHDISEHRIFTSAVVHF